MHDVIVVNVMWSLKSPKSLIVIKGKHFKRNKCVSNKILNTIDVL